MSHPELSLTARPLRERFLDLAEFIVRRELTGLTPWGAGGLSFSWTPRTQESFSDPISLSRIALSHSPDLTSKFTVVSSDFEILGDDCMSLTVSRQMHEADLPNDEWNRMVYERFANSYENHEHAECELEDKRVC
jgi:hypothetical protein